MLYLYPTERRLGIEIVGAEEEHMDLYDALLELVECADGIDDEGVAQATARNERLIDFLYLLRQAEPVPGEYLTERPSGTAKGDTSPTGGADTAGEAAARPKILAFPGVTLPESTVTDDGEPDGDAPGDNGDEDDFGSDSDNPFDEDEIDGLVLEDDLRVRLVWTEAVYLAFALNDYLGWSNATRGEDWAQSIRWRPAYGTVLRFQAQLIDAIVSALDDPQADSARTLFESPKSAVTAVCPQYLDMLGEQMIVATAKRRKAMLAPLISEIAKPGPRNAEIRREAEAQAKELGCAAEEVVFTGEIPADIEW